MSVRRLDPVQPESFSFTADNLDWATKILGNYPAGKQASAVIPVLWRAQEQNGGWVSRPAMECVAKLLDMSFIRVYEIATFYTMFQLSPVGSKAHIQVCGTTPCMLRGAEDLKKVCQRRIHSEPHQLSADGSLSWEEVECLGACVNAPMVQIWKDTYEDLTPQSFEKVIDGFLAGKAPKAGPQNGRQLSAPEGGATTLTDPGLFAVQRSFQRVEPPPAAAAPPPPAAPVIAPPAPATAPPSNVAKPASAAQETAPGLKAPTEVKTSESAVELAKMAERAKPAAPTPPKAAVTASPPAAGPKVEAKAPAFVAPPPRAEPPAPQALATPKEPKDKAAAAGKSGEPELSKKPRSGKADDLKLIWGVGPKLEKMLNRMGVWHFDQIAAWSKAELKWVDERLEGFKGRASRDEWVKQAKKLAKGWRPQSQTGEKPK